MPEKYVCDISDARIQFSALSFISFSQLQAEYTQVSPINPESKPTFHKTSSIVRLVAKDGQGQHGDGVVDCLEDPRHPAVGDEQQGLGVRQEVVLGEP